MQLHHGRPRYGFRSLNLHDVLQAQAPPHDEAAWASASIHDPNFSESQPNWAQSDQKGITAQLAVMEASFPTPLMFNLPHFQFGELITAKLCVVMRYFYGMHNQ